MKVFRLFLIACFVTALAGCAASGPKYGALQASGAITSVPAGKGRVYFYRESAFAGQAVRPDLKLDGKVVGESIPGGFFYVDLAPGSHSAVTSTEVDRTVTFTLDAGETKYIKTSISIGLMIGHVIPELVDQAEGIKALADCSYTGGDAKS